MAYSDVGDKSTGDTINESDWDQIRANFQASAVDIVTTKGDLTVATGADVLVRLGVGANDTILVADSGETSGLAWQAVPGCRVTNSGDISIGASSWTSLTFDTERFDLGGMHDTVTNPSRITVPAGGAGIYMIGASVRFTSDANQRMRILLNGTTPLATTDHFYDSGSGPTNLHFSICTLYDLGVGDYVQVQVYTGSGEDVKKRSNDSPEFWAIWQRRP